MSGKFVDYYYIVTCNRFKVALIIVINERTREVLNQTACTLLVGEGTAHCTVSILSTLYLTFFLPFFFFFFFLAKLNLPGNHLVESRGMLNSRNNFSINSFNFSTISLFSHCSQGLSINRSFV